MERERELYVTGGVETIPFPASLAQDVYACTRVCRTWEPAASIVLWESVVVRTDKTFVDMTFASFCSSFRLGPDKERADAVRFLDLGSVARSWCVTRALCRRFFERLQGLRGLKWDTFCGAEIADILPRLNVSSPLLVALDIESEENFPIFKNAADVAEIASTFARLEPFVSSKRMRRILFAAIGPALRFWGSERFPPAVDMTATSLPLLECVEFGTYYEIKPDLMRKLESFQPSLRRTIQHLNLRDCNPITDATLSVLSNYPLLHCLEISSLPNITPNGITNFLRARGSELRFLNLDWVGPSPFAAIASYAQNMEHIVI
ncbi:hypothetical protein BDK51DRAFT_49762 [Blyttiomyces helicus]|uniref:F-box domain-containing protein n=1 Tax=Blyttiomyces helicus TaxID=388810 RepID=A0A4P9VVJ8_9FUNG|nr:hypothetical protein BDK51DRAFT_49762 [Blyttiomyces helicus]|eukprot:RKO83679.1 hypothetical protein BDK51DRAFT_49762 [Blyttiomyces helicus]